MMRFAACLLVMSLACGFAAPALCAGSAPKPMPCCDPERNCDTGLGRPSCCIETPADGGHGPAVPSDTPSRALDVTTTAPTIAAADLALPFHAVALEERPAPGTAPPLFLLHSTFLC